MEVAASNLQTVRRAGIVSNFSESERSAAKAFCFRQEDDLLFECDMLNSEEFANEKKLKSTRDREMRDLRREWELGIP
jgi:hypothetical protein